MGQQEQRNRMHEKVFRAWCNSLLRHRDVQIDNLFEGLADGVNLLILTELLTRKVIKVKTYKNPTRDIHRLENVSIALRTLKAQHANWRALDIEPKEVVTCQKKTVLGLCWQFVLRFQILDEDDIKGPGTALQKARQKVLDWWKEQVGDVVDIVSIDKSFTDGMAIIALCAKIAPAGEVDVAGARRLGAKARAQLALDLANKHLGILPLLDADDMVSTDPDERPDEQCLLTYVSEFPPAFKALKGNIDREAEYKSMVEQMRTEHEEQERKALAEIQTLKAKQEQLQAAQENELRRLKEQTDALLAENQAMTEREKQEAIEALQKKMADKEERVRQAMLKLKRHQEEQEAQLRQETEEALRKKEEELKALEAEKAAEVARMQREKEELAAKKAAELAQLQQQADTDIRAKEEQMEAQRLENEMRAKLSRDEFEKWKAGKMAELERVRLEREALEKLSMEELQRLREENDRLKRGVPHNFVKKKFGAPTWCNLCKSFLATGGAQCPRCKYTICAKCLRRNPPNNCIPPDEDDDDDDDDGGASIKNKEKVAEIEALPTVREGILVKKGLNRGNWQERRFVLKAGGHLLYYTKSSKPKLKGMVSLSRAEIVPYDKPEKRQWAFGLKSKTRTLWMSALSEVEMTAWQRVFKEQVAITDGTVVDSVAAVKSDKAIIRFFDAADDNKMWTLALEANARPADALQAWAKKAKLDAADYEIWEVTVKGDESRKVAASQPLADLKAIRDAAGKQIKFVVKKAGSGGGGRPALPPKGGAAGSS